MMTTVFTAQIAISTAKASPGLAHIEGAPQPIRHGFPDFLSRPKISVE